MKLELEITDGSVIVRRFSAGENDWELESEVTL